MKNRSAILLILLGVISWSLVMVKSGLCLFWGHGCFSDIGFWGPNGHDGIWHIALAQSLARGSWEMPTFAGEVLKNYHVGFDLLLAYTHKLTGISIPFLYFQIFPILMALGIGIASYLFVFVWTKSKLAAWWSTFFVYFGGSIGWLVTLVREGKLGGESMFWSQQSISTLVNPPFALSLIFMLVGCTLLYSLNKKYNIFTFLSAVLVFGLLIQIKAYAGILSLGGIMVIGLYQLLREKKLVYLTLFGGSLLISIVLFLPLNSGSTGLLVFKPFWFLETMMGLSDRFGWNRFYEAMVNYRLGGNYLKMILAYSAAFVVFIVGNFWTRLLAKWWKLREGYKSLIHNDYIAVFIVSVVIAGIVIPTFFLQAGTPWNTIQFMYYSLVFTGILAGISMADILKTANKKLQFALSVLVVVLTIPTTIATLMNDYLPSRPPAKISYHEMSALKFLENKPQGVVLTYNYDEYKAKEAINNPPRPLYLYESTAYVSAYTNKQVYLEDEVNLNITGYDWRKRRLAVEDFVTTLDEDLANKFLSENNIKYLYLVKNLTPNPGEIIKVNKQGIGIEEIFNNSEVVIYQVN